MTAVPENYTWLRFDSKASLVEQACHDILAAARNAIAAHGTFSMVLAGGSTPADLYEALADEVTDWQHWRIYFGDERCLPPDHRDRNSAMAATRWLDRIEPPAGVFPIPAELGPVAAAQAYAETIRDVLPFDLVLLGAGQDGHTASLFPGDRHPPDALVNAVFDAPKPPPERVSVSYAALCNCADVKFLVTGSDKAGMVRRWHDGEDLPVNRVHGRRSTQVYLDTTAAADLGAAR